MRPTVLVVSMTTSLLVVLLALGVSATAGDGDGEVQGDTGARHSLLRHLPLPNLFKFEQFKSKFNKHYATLLEELARRKIFLGRAFCAFISLVKYVHFRLDHYLGLNRRSDQTPAERQRRRHSMAFDSGFQLPAAPIPVAEPQDIEVELEEIERHGREPGYRDMVEEMRELQRAEEERGGTRKRRRRSIYPEEQPELRLSVGPLVTRADSTPAPPTAPPPPSSKADEQPAQRSLPGQVANLILRLPGAEYLNSLVRSAVSDSASAPSDLAPAPSEPVVARRRNRNQKHQQQPDQVFVDLRESGCLGEPGDQGDCGACYAFAVVALYEYLYCGATGHLLAFSPQYKVSCGARAGLNHCEGAGMSAALSFVDQFGLELLEDQPYLEANGTCPFGAKHRGQVWAEEERGFGYVPFENFDLYLQSRPIFFALSAPDDFDDYSGGVHDGQNCQSEDAHGMLIVGHGREDGHEYYLFRNSYGEDWGERGYFKFRKESIRNCSSYKFGFASLAQFRSDHFERLTRRRAVKSLDLHLEDDEGGDGNNDKEEAELDAETEEAERKRKRRRRKSGQQRRRRQRKASTETPQL